MRWMLFVAAGLAAVVALVAIVGAMLPRDHVATRTLATRHTPEELWALITDPAFARDATGEDVPVETVESVPPNRLVSRIADPNLPFGGTWTYTIAKTPTGATLTIAEAGYVSNVIFRFVSRFVIGHHATMDKFLKAVASRLKEDPVLTGQ